MERLIYLISLIAISAQSFGAVTDVSRRPANIIGAADERGPVVKIGASLNLTPAQIHQIRNNVGYITCPGNAGQNVEGQSATAFLIADDVIATVAHAFFDEMGRLRAKSVENCYFTPQGDNRQSGSVRWATYVKEQGMVTGTYAPSGSTQGLDYAIVKLQKAVPNAQPFIVPDSSELGVNMEIYPVIASRATRYQVRDNPDPVYEPLIQKCAIRKTMDGDKFVPSRYYSDCDNTAGGSGGPNLIIRQGKLVVQGIFQGAGGPKVDGKEYYDRRHTTPIYAFHGRNYPGKPFVLETPESPCTDGSNVRSMLLHIHSVTALEFNSNGHREYVTHNYFEVVRNNCHDVANPEMVELPYDSGKNFVGYRDAKYFHHPSTMTTQGVRPEENLSVAYSIHMDSVFLTKAAEAVQDSRMSTQAIGRTIPNLPPITPTALPLGNSPVRVQAKPAPSGSETSKTGYSGFLGSGRGN